MSVGHVIVALSRCHGFVCTVSRWALASTIVALSQVEMSVGCLHSE